MSTKTEGTLIYDFLQNRFDICYGPEEYYGGLHCGEQFEAWDGQRWIPVRIEMNRSGDWYLAGMKDADLMGRRVRF